MGSVVESERKRKSEDRLVSGSTHTRRKIHIDLGKDTRQRVVPDPAVTDSGLSVVPEKKTGRTNVKLGVWGSVCDSWSRTEGFRRRPP